ERSMKLLIADDHPVVLAGLEALLSSANHNIVAQCVNGEQVLQAISATSPEIIVLDVQMPKLTGLDILRHVKARQIPIRVVLLSSSINSSQALEAVRLGVDGLVLKEAASEDLLRCLEAVAAGGR